MLRVADRLDVNGARVPFVGRANAWVEDLVLDPASDGLTKWLIQQAVEGTQPGQLEVIVFDDELSGVSAPFDALNTGGEKLLRTLHDAQELGEVFAFLRDHIQGVNNVMKGMYPTLVDYRAKVGYPVEGYKLVVLNTDVSLLGEGLVNQLSILLRSGPRAGVSFLIHSVVGEMEYLSESCEVWSVRGGRVHHAGLPVSAIGWQAPAAAQLIASAKQAARSLATTAMDPIPFDSVQPLDRPWAESSLDGVSFVVGRYGADAVEITLGDELNQRHNMLVTGAVGQGKSNLISVMIHSLCQRYSPDELGLYLLDFKEGITLRPFYDEETGEFLPHARVLGLEADREFGLSLFRHLHRIYKERMRAFKSVGVQNLRQYRELRPREAMPRFLVIIDEFQMMFTEQDQISDEIADLLVRGARLFRACGIHIVLASQTIGGNLALMGSSGEGLFAQVPVRIALKNSLSESHATLGVRNDGAVHLRSRQAIVNLDYGEPSANRKTSVAFADESLLGGLRRGWWQRAAGRTGRPYVFVGDQARSLGDDFEWIGENAGGAPVALLGYQIEVDAAPLAVPFGRDVGRNVAILGAGDVSVEVASICLSLAAQFGGRAEFVILELTDSDPFWNQRRDDVISALRGRGCSVVTATRDSASDILTAQAEEILASPSGLDREVFVVGLGMDRHRSLPMEFQDLCKNGSAAGVHVIGWWAKLDAFRDQVGYGGENYFDVKLALRLDPSSAKQFVNDPLLQWRPADNRALVWDSAVLVAPTRVIPYTLFP